MLSEKQVQEFVALLAALKHGRKGGSGLLKELTTGEATALAEVVSNLLKGHIPGINIKKIEKYRNTLREINQNKKSKRLVKLIAGKHAVQLQRALLYLRPFLRKILGVSAKDASGKKKRKKNIVREMWTTPQLAKAILSPGQQTPSPQSSRRSSISPRGLTPLPPSPPPAPTQFSPLTPQTSPGTPASRRASPPKRRRLVMSATPADTPRTLLQKVINAGSPGGPPAGTRKIVPATATGTSAKRLKTRGKTPAAVPPSIERLMRARMGMSKKKKKKSPSTKASRSPPSRPLMFQPLNG